MNSRRPESIQAMWRAHMDRPFPARMRGEEFDGVDMVVVDADIAGCVSTWLASTGDLDAHRLGILRQCRAEVSRVIDSLEDDTEIEYYDGLREMASAVLTWHQTRRRPE